MRISVRWSRPIPLRSSKRLIYECEDVGRLPRAPGVYVFARRFGSSLDPLYIGRATSLRSRIRQQLESNVQLMRGIQTARKGNRVLAYGEVKLKPGQRQDKVLKILEASLIEHALTRGSELLNKQGTKTPVHHILSNGNRSTTNVFPKKMLVRRGKE